MPVVIIPGAKMLVDIILPFFSIRKYKSKKWTPGASIFQRLELQEMVPLGEQVMENVWDFVVPPD